MTQSKAAAKAIRTTAGGRQLGGSWAARRRAAARPAPASSELSRAAVRLGTVARRDFDNETHPALVRRARKMNKVLTELYPDAHCELDFTNPLELLVATILSAQCTDKRVNMVTPTLFGKYKTAADYAAADRAEFESLIASTGFFRAKTNSILGMAQALCDRFGGEVPNKLKDLVTLPGVGRKTANVVLGNAFDVPGITVDTHMMRLANRFRWTSSDDAVKAEQDIGALIPRKEWTLLSHRVIWHGRRVCHARKPACGACALAPLCPSYGTGPTDEIVAQKLVKTGPIEALP